MSNRFALLRVILFMLIGLTATFFAGCAGLGFLTEKPADYLDGTEIEQESWTSEAGTIGRGNRARQTDPDSWWGKYIISPKHRAIENNLGIDHR
ncbi:MAG: hypothetical protein Tsb009_04710 [Planctomycetaceae bacterium]